MFFRMRGRCYNEKLEKEASGVTRRVTTAEEKGGAAARRWYSQSAIPLELRAQMVRVKRHDLWGQRYELAAAVGALQASRGAAADAGASEVLSDEEWGQVVRTLGWWNERTSSDAEDSLHRQVVIAKTLYEQMLQVEAKLAFEPRDAKGDEWVYVDVELPAESVRGTFTMWQNGMAPHLVYSSISSLIPHIRPHPSDATARNRGSTRCLVVELSSVHKLIPMISPVNPYLEAEVGGVRFVCQPQLDAGVVIDYRERFVVFVDEPEKHGEKRLKLLLRLRHKQAGRGAPQSLGGPPYSCAELASEVEAILSAALSSELYRREQARDRTTRMVEQGCSCPSRGRARGSFTLIE